MSDLGQGYDRYLSIEVERGKVNIQFMLEYYLDNLSAPICLGLVGSGNQERTPNGWYNQKGLH